MVREKFIIFKLKLMYEVPSTGEGGAAGAVFAVGMLTTSFVGAGAGRSKSPGGGVEFSAGTGLARSDPAGSRGPIWPSEKEFESRSRPESGCTGDASDSGA